MRQRLKLFIIVALILSIIMLVESCGKKAKDKIVRSTATGTSTHSSTATSTATFTLTYTGTTTSTGTGTTGTGTSGTGTATTNTGTGTTNTGTGTGSTSGTTVLCYVTGEQYCTGHLDNGVKKDNLIWTYHSEGDLDSRKGFVKFDVSALPGNLSYDSFLSVEVQLYVTKIGPYGGYEVLRVAPVRCDPVLPSANFWSDTEGDGAGAIARDVVLDHYGWNNCEIFESQFGIYYCQQRDLGRNWVAMKFYNC